MTVTDCLHIDIAQEPLPPMTCVTQSSTEVESQNTTSSSDTCATITASQDSECNVESDKVTSRQLSSPNCDECSQLQASSQSEEHKGYKPYSRRQKSANVDVSVGASPSSPKPSVTVAAKIKQKIFSRGRKKKRKVGRPRTRFPEGADQIPKGKVKRPAGRPRSAKSAVVTKKRKISPEFQKKCNKSRKTQVSDNKSVIRRGVCSESEPLPVSQHRKESSDVSDSEDEVPLKRRRITDKTW